MLATHSEGIDYVARRLWEKGREPILNVPIRDGERLYSEADVLTAQRANGKLYLTRYEIKSGDGRHKARKQMRAWYALYEGMEGVVPRFVYYNTREERFERWRKPS